MSFFFLFFPRFAVHYSFRHRICTAIPTGFVHLGLGPGGRRRYADRVLQRASHKVAEQPLPSIDILFNALTTLLVTIDPPGLAPLFLALTGGMNRAERFSVATRATIIATVVLVGFLFAGSAILSALGITLHAFRVAGGLLLFYIAFEMIFEKRQERHERTSERAVSADHIANIAAFPLAVPLIAGPGAISATILLSGQFSAQSFGWAWLVAIVVVVMVIVMAAFVLAERIDRYLGATGRTILTRLLGLLLAALSVQFVADGIKALIVA